MVILDWTSPLNKFIILRFNLKEKLPQVFMQIGWMEDDFRNLTEKFGQIWIIQSRDFFFKGFINFVYVALSGGTLLIPVMSQQYNCLMEL